MPEPTPREPTSGLTGALRASTRPWGDEPRPSPPPDPTATASIMGSLADALDPAGWATRRVGFTPDPWQADVLRSGARRILLLCSRQAGKSTVTAVLATHTALFNPGCTVVIVARAQRQSGELLGKIRGFLDAAGIVPERQSDISVTLPGGSRLVSVPGSSPSSIRGFSSPELLIVDEAAFVPDETIAAVFPMVATGGRIAMLTTPQGKSGAFYEAWTAGGDVWLRRRVPATECPRITEAFLAEERERWGPSVFAREYEATFRENDAALFSEAVIEAALRAGEVIEPLRLFG